MRVTWWFSFIWIFRNEQIGHFTQLVRDEAYAVGCAIIKFTKDNKFTVHIACDYSLSNILGFPIYRESARTASGCKKGINEQYPGLCSTDEIYDNDLFYTHVWGGRMKLSYF